MGKRRQEKLRRAELRLCSDEISELKTELISAYQRFDGTADADALDACIFEIGALRSRYNTAIKHYREKFYTDQR